MVGRVWGWRGEGEGCYESAQRLGEVGWLRALLLERVARKWSRATCKIAQPHSLERRSVVGVRRVRREKDCGDDVHSVSSFTASGNGSLLNWRMNGRWRSQTKHTHRSQAGVRADKFKSALLGVNARIGCRTTRTPYPLRCSA